MTERPNRRGAQSSQALQQAAAIRLPAFPPAPPAPVPFVGREREQAQAIEMLSDRGVVALTGVQGSGKTALASAICQASESLPFWIVLAPGLNDSVQALLWQLARPLIQLAPDVWRTLHQIEQAGWDYPPIVRLQIILDAYARQPQETLLCIDRLEYIGDVALESLVVGLCDYVARTHATHLKLIVAGTVLPYRSSRWALPALQGLTPEALQQWAHERAITLGRAAAEQFVRQTGGLPQAAWLFFEAIARDPDAVATANIMALPEIRRYVGHLLAELTSAERSMLERLAGHPLVSSAFSSEERAQVLALEDNHLATLTGNTVAIHPLLRSFHRRYYADR